MSQQELARKVRTRETRLIEALIKGGQDQGGIIGKRARGTLERMPSSVYWRGLRVWGIRIFSGSIDQYTRRQARERPRTTGEPPHPAMVRAIKEPGERHRRSECRQWYKSIADRPDARYE